MKKTVSGMPKQKPYIKARAKKESKPKVKAMTKSILDFLKTNPSDAAIEDFYTNKVLPFDKRSISEILGN